MSSLNGYTNIYCIIFMYDHAQKCSVEAENCVELCQLCIDTPTVEPTAIVDSNI